MQRAGAEGWKKLGGEGSGKEGVSRELFMKKKGHVLYSPLTHQLKHCQKKK